MLTTIPEAVVVPSQAVQAGQTGPYVFIVKEDGGDLIAVTRPIAVGKTANGETVVEQGLSAGDRVLTDGHVRVVPGGKIEVKASLRDEAQGADASQASTGPDASRGGPDAGREGRGGASGEAGRDRKAGS